MGRDEWLDRLSDWWDRTVSEPAWLAQLDEQASTQGVGEQYSRCFIGHSHLRRRTAKRLAAAALVCALIPLGLGVALPAAAVALGFTLGSFSYERLRVPPSRMLDLWQAAAFVVVPSAVLAIGGLGLGSSLRHTLALLAIPLAASAAVLLLADSWFFTRAIWFTCPEGLVASTGRGRIRTSFRWAEIRSHRMQSVVPPESWSPWAEGGVRSLSDEWWLTLDNGRTEHLVLHRGSAFFRQAPGADPLTHALARGIERARTADARAALARGEPVSFGPVTLSAQNLEVDGITIPRHGTSWARGTGWPPPGIAWGRRRWRGGWETTTPASRKGRMRSVVVMAIPEGGDKVVPTREISSLFVLDSLQPLVRYV
jgi:hypothetical protein